MIESISITDGLIMSVAGLGVVFVALVAIMAMIKLLSLLGGKKPQTTRPETVIPTGETSEVCIYDVDDKTAAMIMAIVADETGIPLKELKFKTITEVKDEV